MLYLLLLASLAAAAPISDREIIIPAKFFKDSFVIYSGSHDIVEITVPLNELNYPEGPINDSNHNLDYIFFVEADQNPDGTKNYKGAYVYHDGEAKMIFEKGQTVTYAKQYKIYIGASDGIYVYNHNDNSVKKYGSETRSVIKMAFDVHNELVYYLTSDYVLHKFDKGQVTSTEVHAVKDVRDFVFDYAGNLFYYDGSKNFFAYNGENVVKIEGLSGAKQVFIMNSPMVNLAYTVVDGALYAITIEGKSEYQNLKYEAIPMAYATDFIVAQYYSYNKKIYCFNTSTMEQKVSKQEFEELFEGAENIKTIAKATHAH